MDIAPGEFFIMIGDRASDRKAAEDNGIDFIGCSFGHGPDELSDTRWVAHSFNDIYGIVKEIEFFNQGK
jgi:phosphoglycolate phosphatase-like HAD superfamily hydrolase